jgi:hypothetical protein
MKKINFTEHVLPHLIAVAAFLIVTLFFFKPIFFDGLALQQGDIEQFKGASKEIADYRQQTGEEGLWASTMFSGMPAYLVSVKWGTTPVAYVERALSLFLPSPVDNIFLAFISYYILLLCFRVRPYLAVAGAIAFGLSTYMIIGIAAGHNGRMGAIALMPLVIAGIHLLFSGKRILGFGLTAMGMALHLQQNHLQITYYMLIIMLVYGIVQLVMFIRENKVAEFLKSTALIVPAVALGIGTFAGQLWAINEYTAYSIRGKSELVSASPDAHPEGLGKTYAFEYSNGIFEPLSLMIPDAFGGSSYKFFAQDRTSKTFQALNQHANDASVNQLAQQSTAYWGPQGITLTYYAGAIVVFLFAVGIAFAEKKYVWWLLPVGIISIVLSWGDNFETFNYFLFNHLPGYNKFRSVTFAIIMLLFALPLLGMLGLEKLFQQGVDKAARKKLLIAFGSTAGLCLLLIVFGGLLSFMKEEEATMPAWFTNALAADRLSLLRADAFRSLIFISLVFVPIYFDLRTKLSQGVFFGGFIFLIMIDLAVVNKRAVTTENYKRKRDVVFNASAADLEILKDKSYYRVFNLQNPMNEAQTSYYHHSIGGYHGAKLRRYQDLIDSSLVRETNLLAQEAQTGKINFNRLSTLNMLNVKYLKSGDRVIRNTAANGPAWFVLGVFPVNDPTAELERIKSIDNKSIAVIDQSKFKIQNFTYDSANTITLQEHKPNYLRYESQSTGNGLAVFSEIYYPEGWKALIDGNEVPIIRANYVLRALEIPAGKHKVEFKFEPDAFFKGNKITTTSSWATLLVLLGSLGLAFRQKE